MQTPNFVHNVTIALLTGVIGALTALLPASAANVGSGGYTNGFTAQPNAADWSTLSLGGAAGDHTTTATFDPLVLAVTAASVNAQVGTDTANPPAANAAAIWTSGGNYVQTRPTGNAATLLMCTLVNTLGSDANSVTISYDFTRATTGEELNGHRAFYSLTGAANSWTLIPAFTAATSSRLTATLTLTWPNNGTLYLLWADDNGSPGPDDENRITAFAATATPAIEIPVSITSPPTNTTVNELAPAAFTIGLSGFPLPTVQWYTNGTAIPNATNTSYAIASTPLALNGMQFTAIAQNVASNITTSVTSSPVTLTVNADTNRPTLVSVFSAGVSAVAVAYSERVAVATATNLSNYLITNNAGVPLTILSATLAPDLTNVTLTTAAQTLGAQYRIVINNVRDLSSASNAVAANTLGTFITADFTATDIGSPGYTSTLVAVNGGYNLTGAGTDFGGTSDQFSLSYQQRSGDFDLAVRVAALKVTDPWAKASLMARETLNANSAFAAAVAAPSTVGSFFESRASAGAAAVLSGYFPPSFPHNWLRLKRAANVVTGYASADGQTWVLLGTSTISAGPVYVGFAVASRASTTPTTAEFRDYGNVAINSTIVTAVDFSNEPLAACTRKTPLVITELMYRPGGTNTNNLEFVEIYNSNPIFENLTGHRLSGVIDYPFPEGTILPGGGTLVIAKNPAAVQAYYGITGVLGPYTNSLPTSGTLRLRSEVDAVLLEINYADGNPWPAGADSTGHSLVLDRPSLGENDPRAWGISATLGGSPGQPEPMKMRTGLNAVVINEFLAHTDDPFVDYIELYNYSTNSVDISGCWLSDSPSTNIFPIPASTILPPGGFIAFGQTQLGFSLRAAGETIYLRSPDGTRLLDTVKFEAQENGVATGRHPNGAPDFFRLASQTPGTNNAAPRVDDIVINELMYGPISENEEDQFIELHNKGVNPINLKDWRFTAGIDFKFPAGASIPAGGYVVVAKNKSRLQPRYAQLNANNLFGDYSGKLSRNGERVAIAKPDYSFTTNGGIIFTNIDYIVVDEVSYKPGGRWGQWSDQGGSSLELIDPRANHRMAFNWGDSDETGKAPWTLIEQTGRMDQGSAHGSGTPDRLEVIMLGAGECLLDDVSVITNISSGATAAITNPGFEGGGTISPWVAQGNHVLSSLENSGYNSAKSLHIRSSGNGDTGGNRIRVAMSPVAINSDVKLRAYARWLRGWPEVLLRVEGNFMEAYGPLAVPENLGSPGLPNSRAAANTGPAIADLRHFPVLPAASEPVVVSARVHDPDGATSVSLRYRIDPGTTFTALTMNDSGTGGDRMAGDGIYSATLPGQASGLIVAFYVQATDSLGATNLYPENAPTLNREALVRWGDPQFASSFAVYRMWISQVNINTYTQRPAVSNQDVDSTMVINNYRVIYNMGSTYGGSPYHQTQNSSPVTGNVHYQAAVPKDDMYLGTDNFNKIHAPGNGAFDDGSIMREQIAFWLVRKTGIPFLYRRYINMYVNGNRKGGANQLMEDSQRPGGEMIDQWYPDENEGRLFKIQPWFEWDDVNVTGAAAAGFENKRWCQLTTLLSTNNAHKKAAYRYNWLARSADETANDYNDVFAVVSAASLPSSSPNYWASFSAEVDIDQWANMFAVQHAVGNWDSFGSQNAQNTYGYKPKGGKWKQFIWDFNIVLGNSGSWGPGVNLFSYNTADASMGVLNNYPPFRRAWLRAYKLLAVGPNASMLAANVDPVIDARTTAFSRNGITPGVAGSVVKTWISDARTIIASTVAGSDTANFTVSTPTVTASSNLVTISGAAPLEITDIRFNGVSYPVTWTSVTAWTVKVPVTNSTSIVVAAFDGQGAQVGANSPVSVTYTATPPASPAGFIVFNELMFAPSVPDAEYIELYNTHSNFTFNLAGFRINGLDYTFPSHSYIQPRSYLVLAKDRVAFSTAYGPTTPVFDVFGGSLQGNGETLTLLMPGATTNDVESVIDKVFYENKAPWTTNANDTGSSLQLVDLTRDNSRVGNWVATYTPAIYAPESSTPAVVRDGWRFVSATGTLNPTNTLRLVMYLGEVGSALVDDLFVVLGTNAAVGSNYVRNGDFESELLDAVPVTNSWRFGTNYTNSLIVGDLVHAGAGALKINGTFAGTIGFQGDVSKAMAQWLYPLPVNPSAQLTTNTLSFWYWATNSATNLFIRVLGASGLSGGPNNGATNINIFITPSNYVPAMAVSGASNYFSPGSNNQFTASLPIFEPLWINELQAENLTGLLDHHGEREPWIEIYNTSTNTVSLEGLYLTHTYTNYTNWVFPPGSSIGPTQFLVVICDGEPAETTNTEYHTSFRLPGGSGGVALSRLYTNAPQVLDYVNYQSLPADRSYGSYPDGQPFDRQQFFYVTPGGTNDGRSAPLVVHINEWLASNLSKLADPADGQFEDWFELYNPTTNTVDLAGYYLTDTLTDKFKYLITTNGPHTIAPLGYLLVWADNEVNQNTSGGIPRADLHVNFQLAKTGDSLGLFAADGSAISTVTFFGQIDDVSTGHFPDGTGPYYFMTNTTPRLPNFFLTGSNAPPVLNPIGTKIIYLGQTLAFTATATDSDVPAQALTFTLDPTPPAGATISPAGFFQWTPSATGTNAITVRVTDGGVPAQSAAETITVEVLAAPSFGTTTQNGDTLEMTWGTRPGKQYAIDYKDDLSAGSWTPLWTNTAIGNSLSYTNATTNGMQRFFRIRTVD